MITHAIGITDTAYYKILSENGAANAAKCRVLEELHECAARQSTTQSVLIHRQRTIWSAFYDGRLGREKQDQTIASAPIYLRFPSIWPQLFSGSKDDTTQPSVSSLNEAADGDIRHNDVNHK